MGDEAHAPRTAGHDSGLSDMTALAAAASTAGLDPFFRCRHLAVTGSTNDDAKALAATGVAEGTLVWADRQTAGRGRRGRAWQSPAGNLYCSVVLRPPVPIRRAGEIGFVAALAIADALGRLLPAQTAVACKWPNDVLVAGRKVAGLLLETAMTADGATEWLVLGIGVNVASHPEDVEFPATSLNAAGCRTTAAATLVGLCDAFARRYAAWCRDGFAAVRADWLARAAGLGEPVQVRLDDRTLDGVFGGLDEEGALLLHSAGSATAAPLRITAGDVFFPATTARVG